MSVFCIPDTICKMQHVAPYRWHILVSLLLCLGILYKMRHFCFGRMSETLAVVALLDRNWRSKFFQLMYIAGYLADYVLWNECLGFGRCRQSQDETLRGLYHPFCFLRLLTHVRFFSKTWSDNFRSVSIYGKEQESRKKKKFHNRAKIFTFLRTFDRRNTFF